MVRYGVKEAHAAGIWSDMTSDGPVIGTLVVVLDRAKNLPNKKKIGKQDPYAVARLAKEAKRTDTDVRGGQVPRWDKELRFPVRDSPDYKTLKISVFNDDKKTDLIGETSVRLDRILVPGGGTDDGWRGLKCKEKYAGEILVELTFYDLRPKEEKKEPKRPKPVTGFDHLKYDAPPPRKLGGAREMGSREKATTIKRRPLPANPLPRENSNSGDDRRTERPREERRRDERRRERGEERRGGGERREGERTRRSRHSYHPDSRSGSHYPPEPERPLPQQVQQHRRRDHRSSASQLPEFNRNSMYANENARHSMYAIVPPQEYGSRPEIYDGGDYMPHDSRHIEEDPYNDPPPPPPPAHREYRDVPPPMEHSLSNGHLDMQPPEPPFQKQLRHYQSMPSFQPPLHHQPSFEQPEASPIEHYQQPLHHQRSFEPKIPQVEQFHQLQQFTPSFSANNFMGQPAQIGYDQVPSEEEPPPLSHVATPASSNPGSRDGPPPPPPPHRQPVGLPSPVIDEPNWDNHRPKSMQEETGLPSYESLTPVPRRPSFNVSPVRNGGIPLPPSLIPGIDHNAMTDGSSSEERRSVSYDDSVRPLQIESSPSTSSRPGTNYHRPQVEEVQDVQIYQRPDGSYAQNQLDFARSRKKQHELPIVKPVPIHGERDEAPLRQPSLNNLVPERKPLPVPEEAPGTLQGIPFGPDSYNAINPHPSAVMEALASRSGPERMIMPGSNKVYDPTDVLGPESYAPEPEVKRRAPRPPPPVPVEHRRERFDRRSVSPVPPRGRLALPAPPPKQVSFQQPQMERNALRKSVRMSKSMASLPRERSIRDRYSMPPAPASGMVLYDPNSERERERQMDREWAERDARALVLRGDNFSQQQQQPYGPRRRSHSGMEVGYYGNPEPKPPVPAKIPLRGNSVSDEQVALSQELSLISIGAGDGRGRRRY